MIADKILWVGAATQSLDPPPVYWNFPIGSVKFFFMSLHQYDYNIVILIGYVRATFFSFPVTRRWVTWSAWNWKLSGKKEIKKKLVFCLSKRLKQIDSTHKHTRVGFVVIIHISSSCSTTIHWVARSRAKGALENVVGAVKTKTTWWHWERTRKSMAVSCCCFPFAREGNFLAPATNQVLSVIPLHLCHVAHVVYIKGALGERGVGWKVGMSTELVSRRFDNSLLAVEGGVKGQRRTAAYIFHLLPSLTIPIHFHSLQAFKQFIRIYASCRGLHALIARLIWRDPLYTFEPHNGRHRGPIQPLPSRVWMVFFFPKKKMLSTFFRVIFELF